MDIQPLEILKWVGIVLAAGFVGYFGRHMAMLIIDRMRRKQTEQKPVSAVRDSIGSQNGLPDQAALKLEKKRGKAESKRLKKQDKSGRG